LSSLEFSIIIPYTYVSDIVESTWMSKSSDNLLTNQLTVSQVSDWSTCRLDD